MRRSPRLFCTAVLTAALTTAGAASARAQDEPSADLPPPLRVTVADGDVTLVRDGAPVAVEPNLPLIEGDRLRTAGGRAELGLPRGAVIFLDRHSALDVRAYNRVRLLEGRLRVASPGSAEPPDLVVDAPGATITPSSVASFLVEATVGPRGDEVVVRVDDGVVELAGDRETLLVRAGESAALRADGRPTPASGYTRAERNEFDVWTGERMRAYEPGPAATPAADYLPDELGSYRGTLSRYGSWDYDEDYGHVWYPSVEADWRPYSVGRWDRVGAYGWFWIGSDPWAWPTHHYGRWGYRAGRWFWAPRRVWAPAWVSWSIGPGYVGWCPLGFDDRPVFGFGLSFGSWGSPYYYRGRPYYDRYDYWRGWSVLPSDRFHGRRYSYGRDYIDARRLPREVTSAFVTQRVPPSAWNRGGSRYAVPRYGTPRGPWGGGGGSGIGDTRVDSPRGPAYAGPGVARPRGGDAGVSPYDRAQPYMDRRNVPGRAGGERPPGAAEPYERARPYMNPRYTPGTSPGDGLPDGARPRGNWGESPRVGTPRVQPPPEVPRSPGDTGWGGRSGQPRGSYRNESPRSAPPGYAPRGSGGDWSSRAAQPRSSYRVEAPRAAAPRSAPSRSWSGGGGSAPRSTPRAGSGSRGSSGSSGRAVPRSRSPRG